MAPTLRKLLLKCLASRQIATAFACLTVVFIEGLGVRLAGVRLVIGCALPVSEDSHWLRLAGGCPAS